MDGEVRRKLEMVARSVEFHGANPSDSKEYEEFMKGVGDRLARSAVLLAQQRQGFIDVRAAAERKDELMHIARTVHLPHLTEAGRAAAKEDHELGQAFSRKPGSNTLLGFRSTLATVLATAQANKEVLVRHGMSPQVLDDLAQLLAEFDAAIELGSTGRAAHVGASRELRILSTDLVKSVRMMDGVNRLRYRDNPSLLGAWENVSRIHAAPKSADGEPESTGAPSPAAAAPADGSPAAPAPGTGEARPAA
ncbi:MAG: hypothetical protein ACTHM9_16925 [Gemmatimonadales bacterium]